MSGAVGVVAGPARRPTPPPRGSKVAFIGRLRVPGAVAWLGGGAIFFSLSRLHQQIAVLGALRIVMVLNLIALGILLSSTGRWRPADLKESWVTRYVFVIVMFAIIGGPFALYPGQAFYFFRDAYSRTLLLGVIAWSIARTPDGARFLARLVALSGMACALNSLLLGRKDASGRLSGAFTYDPNDLALICVATMPLAIWWTLDRSSRWRWVGLLGIAVLGYTVVETGSRGGFLGILGVFMGFLFYAMKGENKKMKKVGRAVIALGILSFPFLPADYRSTLTTIRDEDDYNRTAPTGRIQTWKRGIGYAMTHPLLGVGLNNFQTAEGWISPLAKNLQPGQGLKWSTAHNSYIQVAAELGIIPGIYFLLLIMKTTATLTMWNKRQTRARRLKAGRGPPDLPLAMFLGLAFVGYGISGFFLSFAYYDIVYVMIGMASAMILHRDAEERYQRKLAAQAALARLHPRPRVAQPSPGPRLAPST